MDCQLTEISRFRLFWLFSVTEINRSPYRGVGFRWLFPVIAMNDLFGLEQQPQRTNDRPEAAAIYCESQRKATNEIFNQSRTEARY
jgi:hypothetical protein